MENVLAVIANVQNFRVTETTEITRLTAGERIESGLIEDSFPSGNRAGIGGERFGRKAAQQAGVEGLKIGIVIIEAMRCHEEEF